MTAISLPTLSAWQSRIYKSPKRHKLLMSGRRKGKTEIMKLTAFRVAAEGGYVLWCSGDSDLAEVGWQQLTQWVSRFAQRYAPAGKGIVTLDGGGMIRRVSAAKATSGRGPTPALIVVDECQTVTDSFIKRARPSLMTNNGRMLLAGTPPDNAQQIRDAAWIREMIEHPERFPDWLIDNSGTTAEDIAFMMSVSDPTSKDMPWAQLLLKAQQELDNLRLEMGDSNYQREIEGKWVVPVAGSRVLDEYTNDNYGDQFGFDPKQGDVYWFMDRGEGSAYTVCLFAQVQLDRPGVRVFGEKFTIAIVDEADFVNECKKISDENGWPRPRMAVYDVRAPRFKTALWENGIKPYARNRTVDDGIHLLNSGFRKRWIGFHTRCSHLDGEMRNWRRKASGDPRDDHRDGADALRYGYEYLLDHYGQHWRKLALAGDELALKRNTHETVFTFSWV